MLWPEIKTNPASNIFGYLFSFTWQSLGLEVFETEYVRGFLKISEQ